MALYEFYCEACDHRFEQMTRSDSPDKGKCPKCQSKDRTRKLISKFAVGGRGDLRESTMHGCHDCEVPAGPAAASGSGDHDHDHD